MNIRRAEWLFTAKYIDLRAALAQHLRRCAFVLAVATAWAIVLGCLPCAVGCSVTAPPWALSLNLNYAWLCLALLGWVHLVPETSPPALATGRVYALSALALIQGITLASIIVVWPAGTLDQARVLTAAAVGVWTLAYQFPKAVALAFFADSHRVAPELSAGAVERHLDTLPGATESVRRSASYAAPVQHPRVKAAVKPRRHRMSATDHTMPMRKIKDHTRRNRAPI